MKKITVTLLTLGMVVMLGGCGKDTDANTGTDTSTSVTEDANTNGDEGSNETADVEGDSNVETGATDSVDQGAATDETTLGNKLAAMFEAGIANGDIDSLANELAEATEYDCMVVDANEGYLNGFTEEIKGFSRGKQFAPMIGSIPLVGYIFETDNPEELKDKLTSVADPRWNICTEAAETVCVTSGNYVFFTMCPGEDE